MICPNLRFYFLYVIFIIIWSDVNIFFFSARYVKHYIISTTYIIYTILQYKTIKRSKTLLFIKLIQYFIRNGLEQCAKPFRSHESYYQISRKSINYSLYIYIYKQLLIYYFINCNLYNIFEKMSCVDFIQILYSD